MVYNEKMAKLNKINWKYYPRDDGYIKERFLNKDFDTFLNI